uniref:Uncharacterized protein n=1 Tax=Rhizophora mucronata TaxID=61149 RepID=A0A2P2QYS9_RHIMU
MLTLLYSLSNSQDLKVMLISSSLEDFHDIEIE